MKDRVKILLVQTANMNFGDEVIGANNDFLLRKAIGSRPCDILHYSISSRDIGQLKYVDAVVFAGGILKATNEKFWIYIPELIQEAQKLGVPVFLNGIGVEPAIPGDERSEALKEAVNLPVVKGISVRDDLDLLKSDYMVDPDIPLYRVTDSAVWSRWAYGIKVDKALKQSRRQIGVGIVRERLFADYGHPEMTRDKQIAFWTGVVRELEQKGLPWVLFTNGDRNDELFADEILETVGHGEKLPTPRNADELVARISRMRGVIAGRMHSNIIAYALGVPSVGFVWNRKLRFWSERIGCPERFFSVEEMDPQRMVEVLEETLDRSMRVPLRIRMPSYRAVRKFVKKWCNVRPDRATAEDIDWSKYLVAVGMGGLELRYPATHSLEALTHALDAGYRNLHVDVRLTSDMVPVCISRWHEETFDHLNILTEKEGYQEALPFDTFSHAKWYQRFPTLAFEDFAKAVAASPKKKGLKIFLGVGKPSEEKFQLLLDCLQRQFDAGLLDQKQIILRVERRADALKAREVIPGLALMYHLVPKADTPWEEKCGKDLAWCKKNKVRFVSMNVRNYEGEIPELVRTYPARLYIFTYVKTERMEEAIRDGVPMVGSRYYDVSYLNRLTKE